MGIFVSERNFYFPFVASVLRPYVFTFWECHTLCYLMHAHWKVHHLITLRSTWLACSTFRFFTNLTQCSVKFQTSQKLLRHPRFLSDIPEYYSPDIGFELMFPRTRGRRTVGWAIQAKRCLLKTHCLNFLELSIHFELI